MGLRMSVLRGHRVFRRLGAVAATMAVAVAPLIVAAPQANAAATVERIEHTSAQQWQMYVRSPAMNRTIHLDVLVPANQSASRPTLLLLDGNGASESQPASTWTLRGGAEEFFADKPVNVVMPVGGGGTYYTDWLKDDPKLGHQKWETFLTSELPPLIDRELKGNGVYAVGGLSMGAGAAAILAVRHPDMFRALAAFSGCYSTDGVGQLSVRPVVESKGGNPDNMWGAAGNPEWAAHDPSKHLDALRGKPVHLYVGTGVPGPDDAPFDDRWSWPNDPIRSNEIENISHDCTLAVSPAMKLFGADLSIDYAAVGVHSWPYWKAALPKSWPALKAGLGV
ncbi:alpha/beta hydrolase [Nocardia sp. NPDC052278]|uniref:alpha/beta hydrolase n=1 Tax=unclassified Nocardia TaxID=2637762 RepID=UPI0036A22702